MIQVHDPMAVIVVESVLIAVALAAAHRATEGRLWGWLRSGLAIRAGFRCIAIGLMTLPAGAVAVGLAADGVHPAADLAARFLMGVLAMIVVLAFCLLRAHRLAHEARARDYRHRIDALKGSAAAEAGPAVRTLILALNRCGVTDVNLTCCRLPGADLSRTKLYKARLRGAELKGADLSRVGFTGADLSGARLNDAVLCEAFAYRANLRDADLSRADLRGGSAFENQLAGPRPPRSVSSRQIDGVLRPGSGSGAPASAPRRYHSAAGLTGVISVFVFRTPLCLNTDNDPACRGLPPARRDIRPGRGSSR
jgi:hypothetical protein